MEAPAGPPAGPLNWKALGLLGPALIDELLRTVPGPGPSFGALELDTSAAVWTPCKGSDI